MARPKTRHMRVDEEIFIPELRKIAEQNNITITEASREVGRLLKMDRSKMKRRVIF